MLAQQIQTSIGEVATFEEGQMSKQREQEHTNTTLVRLYQQGRATASDLGLTPVEAQRLRNAGLIRQVAVHRTGRRGRPAYVYACTPKARDRARRRVRAAA